MEKLAALRMGCACADITPEGPVQTVGFGRRDETSRGVLSPLCAQVSVWQRGEKRCCLAAIDHIGFARAHADALRDRLAAQLGVRRDEVMLCFSHCHSAPNDSAEPAWLETACGRIAEAARRALAGMEEVEIAWGNARTTVGLNRRAEGAALDDRLGVLKVCGARDGALRLLLLRATVHNNVLKADNYLISSDFFGAARDRLRGAYGCPVVLLQGASGDVAPRYFRSELDVPDAPDARFIRSRDALSQMAETLLREAAPVIDSLRPGPAERLEMVSRELSLYADVPTALRASEVAVEAQKYCGIDPAGWLAEVDRLHRAGVARQEERVEVQYFAVGRGCLCGVPNEIMCGFALRLSELKRDEFLYFGGYTNGCTGYFPTEEEFDRGGYEVYWSMLVFYMYHGRVFPLRRESAGELIGFAAENAPPAE